jgi:hypothetical protein
MDTKKINSLLTEFPQDKVERYLNYCYRLANEKKNGQLKNAWMQQRSDTALANYFKSVALDGLWIDGDNITIQFTGISYNYQAYKDKMLMVYPESTIDLELVYKDDKFSFRKESGRVIYTHEINNPFDPNKEANLVGGYFVVKNKRGEFLVTLGADEIEKHRKAAKTDSIWKSWFLEMCRKTLIKKGCKLHFKDTFSNIETIDNENYDLEKPLTITVETKQEIEAFNDVDKLREYCKANMGKNAGVKKDFVKACQQRSEEITRLQNENQS